MKRIFFNLIFAIIACFVFSSSALALDNESFPIAGGQIDCTVISVDAESENDDFLDETQEREMIEVDTFKDINELYKSYEYDSGKLYSFIMGNPPMQRQASPSCGSAAWTGSPYRVDEVDHYVQDCPAAGFDNDDISVYRYYYLERCRSCGYEIVH